MDATEANRQRKLLEAHNRWVEAEGGYELPVHLDTYMRPEQHCRLDWLKANVTGSILDVGCSWGYTLAYLGGDAGVDINPHLVDLARLLSPQRDFRTADARELPFPDDAFDTVVIAETLEHLEWSDGVVAALGEAMRVSRERILITVPAPDSDEALSFKHQWLATRLNMAELALFLMRNGWYHMSDILPQPKGFVVARYQYSAEG